jgi:hypothetical protein
MDLYTFEKNANYLGDSGAASGANDSCEEGFSFQPSLTLSRSARTQMSLPTSPSRAVNDAIASIVANIWDLPCRKIGAMRMFYSHDTDHYLPLSRYTPQFYRPDTMLEAAEIVEHDGLVEHQPAISLPNSADRSWLGYTRKLNGLVASNGLPWAYELEACLCR